MKAQRTALLSDLNVSSGKTPLVALHEISRAAMSGSKVTEGSSSIVNAKQTDNFCATQCALNAKGGASAILIGDSKQSVPATSVFCYLSAAAVHEAVEAPHLVPTSFTKAARDASLTVGG